MHASKQQKQKLNREQKPELTQLAMASNVYSQLRALAKASKTTRSCELHMSVLPVFAFSCLFTRFCFELVFGENMNIVENIFIFLRALV